MYLTYEAVIDETGKVTLLEEVNITERCRALVTILNEEPEIPYDAKPSQDVKPSND